MGYKQDFIPLIEALTSTGLPVGHGNVFKEETPYLAWQETERETEYADNQPMYKKWIVMVWYFTSEEYDGKIDEIEAALSEREIVFDGPQVAYDPERKITQYRYRCEIECR